MQIKNRNYSEADIQKIWADCNKKANEARPGSYEHEYNKYLSNLYSNLLGDVTSYQNDYNEKYQKKAEATLTKIEMLEYYDNEFERQTEDVIEEKKQINDIKEITDLLKTLISVEPKLSGMTDSFINQFNKSKSMYRKGLENTKRANEIRKKLESSGFEKRISEVMYEHAKEFKINAQPKNDKFTDLENNSFAIESKISNKEPITSKYDGMIISLNNYEKVDEQFKVKNINVSKTKELVLKTDRLEYSLEQVNKLKEKISNLKLEGATMFGKKVIDFSSELGELGKLEATLRDTINKYSSILSQDINKVEEAIEKQHNYENAKNNYAKLYEELKKIEAKTDRTMEDAYRMQEIKNLLKNIKNNNPEIMPFEIERQINAEFQNDKIYKDMKTHEAENNYVVDVNKRIADFSKMNPGVYQTILREAQRQVGFKDMNGEFGNSIASYSFDTVNPNYYTQENRTLKEEIIKGIDKYEEKERKKEEGRIKKLEEAANPIMPEKPTYENIVVPGELQSTRTIEYQKYMISKIKNPEEKITFSQFLEKRSPNLTELIRIEKKRESQANTIFKNYVLYVSSLENKKNAISFEAFANKEYGITNIDVPVESEEEYKGMKR